MILADKIIDLRKKEGLSQEELANKLGVSRQSVSKWEGAQSTPDMDKIIKLANLFGVSTDYLLRDEITAPTAAPSEAPDQAVSANNEPLDPVSMEEANAYLADSERHSTRVAAGVALCILSSVPLFILIGMAESERLHLAEEPAGAIGVALLLAIVACGVVLFIVSGRHMERYEHLQKNPLDTAYGVDGMVRERRQHNERSHTAQIAAGIALCVVAAIPVLISVVGVDTNAWLGMAGIAFLLVLVAAGAFLLVRAGIVEGSYNVLLEEKDYTRQAKRLNKRYGSIYWGIVLAVYLLVSLLTMAWQSTWIIWPVAGVAYAVFSTVVQNRR